MKRIVFCITLLILSLSSKAQSTQTVTRIAVLTIDSLQLPLYMKLLQEQMQTAVRLETGVISYNVYADKANLAKLTIVEVYANHIAYESHREAPHFIKYKNATASMVKKLELSEVSPLLSVKK